MVLCHAVCLNFDLDPGLVLISLFFLLNVFDQMTIDTILLVFQKRSVMKSLFIGGQGKMIMIHRVEN